MKTCVSTYSFGKYFKELGIAGTIRKAAELGFLAHITESEQEDQSKSDDED